jgi:hypothetical protein
VTGHRPVAARFAKSLYDFCADSSAVWASFSAWPGYGRDGLKFFVLTEIHQFNAHRVSTGFATLFDSRAHGLAFVCDEHQLV